MTGGAFNWSLLMTVKSKNLSRPDLLDKLLGAIFILRIRQACNSRAIKVRPIFISKVMWTSGVISKVMRSFIVDLKCILRLCYLQLYSCLIFNVTRFRRKSYFLSRRPKIYI